VARNLQIGGRASLAQKAGDDAVPGVSAVSEWHSPSERTPASRDTRLAVSERDMEGGGGYPAAE
jgi:hypothetical protein